MDELAAPDRKPDAFRVFTLATMAKVRFPRSFNAGHEACRRLVSLRDFCLATI
jgi:hypothetical protein